MGHFQNDCVCQTRITAHPLGSSSNGFGCYMTGGHCLPNNNCDSLVKQYNEDEKIKWVKEDDLDELIFIS